MPKLAFSQQNDHVDSNIKVPHFKKVHLLKHPLKVTLMSHLLSLVLFQKIKYLLKKCIGYSLHEALALAQKKIGADLDPEVFKQIHRTLHRIGYLRVMGKCKDYANEEFVTFCWDDAPDKLNRYTDLLIVLEVTHCLEHQGDDVPQLLKLCEPI